MEIKEIVDDPGKGWEFVEHPDDDWVKVGAVPGPVRDEDLRGGGGGGGGGDAKSGRDGEDAARADGVDAKSGSDGEEAARADGGEAKSNAVGWFHSVKPTITFIAGGAKPEEAGGGSLGAATGRGGDEVTGRSGSEAEGRGGGSFDIGGDGDGEEDASEDVQKELEVLYSIEIEVMGRGDEVLPGGAGVGEAIFTGDDDEATRRTGGDGGWFAYTKSALIAGAARILFYPALARNSALNRFLADFHWWDRIDEHVVLGAVPFRKDVPHLMKLGVKAVVALTEPFETLVPISDYQANGIDHLDIATPDYSAAPSIKNICRALHLMHSHALRGDSTYVHCKAGRGRSTTVVLCYLIRFKNMTHEVAWNHTLSKRPRICLTGAQKKTVKKFDYLNRTGGLPLESGHAEKDLPSGGQESHGIEE